MNKFKGFEAQLWYSEIANNMDIEFWGVFAKVNGSFYNHTDQEYYSDVYGAVKIF